MGEGGGRGGSRKEGARWKSLESEGIRMWPQARSSPLWNGDHSGEFDLDQVPGVLEEWNGLGEGAPSHTATIHFHQLISQLDGLGCLSQPALCHADVVDWS